MALRGAVESTLLYALWLLLVLGRALALWSVRGSACSMSGWPQLCSRGVWPEPAFLSLAVLCVLPQEAYNFHDEHYGVWRLLRGVCEVGSAESWCCVSLESLAPSGPGGGTPAFRWALRCGVGGVGCWAWASSQFRGTFGAWGLGGLSDPHHLILLLPWVGEDP